MECSKKQMGEPDPSWVGGNLCVDELLPKLVCEAFREISCLLVQLERIYLVHCKMLRINDQNFLNTNCRVLAINLDSVK